MPAASDARRSALLDLIASLSFKLGDFILTSGQRSDYYIDCRITTLHAEGGRLSGILLYELIHEHFPQAEAIGGLTMGADPVVSNVATASAWELADYKEILELSSALEMDENEDPGPEPKLLHGFLIRKTAKAHGAGRRIEGFLKPGAPVVVVDDALSTGGSTIAAIEAVREAGMNVVGVVFIVDREMGGRTNIAAIAPDAPIYSLFTANDVRTAHLALK
ncbi:MAG TPA: phosphoribosyltransferase family protein [Granulicella sp.]